MLLSRLFFNFLKSGLRGLNLSSLHLGRQNSEGPAEKILSALTNEKLIKN